jgi:hypothetical protein
LQVGTQATPLQLVAPCAFVQAFPQVPQFVVVFVCDSQPFVRLVSQSPQPDTQVSVHRPELHATVAFDTAPQSAVIEQTLPGTQPGQPLPPQSTSVSVPF